MDVRVFMQICVCIFLVQHHNSSFTRLYTTKGQICSFGCTEGFIFQLKFLHQYTLFYVFQNATKHERKKQYDA